MDEQNQHKLVLFKNLAQFFVSVAVPFRAKVVILKALRRPAVAGRAERPVPQHWNACFQNEQLERSLSRLTALVLSKQEILVSVINIV